MPTSAIGISNNLSQPAAPRTMKRCRGFSLLELLLVVVIIGIFGGAVVLSMGIVNDDRDIEREARRLASLLTLLREEALMQSRDYGVFFSETGYRFYTYDYQQLRWVVPTGDDLFAQYDLSEPMQVDLTIEDRDLVLDAAFEAEASENPDEVEDAPEPQVMVLSSGEVTPFSASFYTSLAGARYTLETEIDGATEVTHDDALR